MMSNMMVKMVMIVKMVMMVKMVMVVKVVVTSKRASEHVANTLGGRVPTTSHLIRWGWSPLLCWCWWRGSPWAWFPKVAKVGAPSNPQQCLPPHPPAHIFILEMAHLSVWSSWCWLWWWWHWIAMVMAAPGVHQWRGLPPQGWQTRCSDAKSYRKSDYDDHN